MKSLRPSITLVVSLALACFATACTKKPGEVILVVNTDMALTHDIDSLRVQVYANNQPRNTGATFSLAPPRGGGNILIPATLGITSGHNASDVAEIKAVAYQNNTVRVLREIDLTVPTDRIVELPLAVDWLCTGSGKIDPSDPFQNTFVNTTCEKGFTCVAGKCEDVKVDSAKLDAYVPSTIFGGGTGNGDGVCFDTLKCFESAELKLPDDKDCTLKKPDGTVNVALLVEGDGIRNDSMPPGRGFIPLDVENKEGWTTTHDDVRDIDLIKLPPAVCDGPKKPLIHGIAVTTACELKKTPGTPTCGPWSNVGNGSADDDVVVNLPDAAVPTVVDASVPDIIGDGGCPMSCAGSCASGRCSATVEASQQNPFGITVDADYLYWTDIGTSADGTGSVKKKALNGLDAGTVVTLASGLNSPAGIAVSGGYVYWANEGTASSGYTDGTIVRQPLTGVDGGSLKTIAFGQSHPGSIAVDGTNVYWANLGTRAGAYLDGSVSKAPIDAGDAGVGTTLAPNLLGPVSLSVDTTNVYFTTQGTQANGYVDGAVSSVPIAGGKVVPISQQQAAAQGLALSGGILYWADKATGTIMSAPVDGSTSTMLVSGEDQPNAVATDGEYVYWTTLLQAGLVKKVRTGGGAVTTLATNQTLPAGIAVNGASCFWTTSGTNGADGTVEAVTPK